MNGAALCFEVNLVRLSTPLRASRRAVCQGKQPQMDGAARGLNQAFYYSRVRRQEAIVLIQENPGEGLTLAGRQAGRHTDCLC